MTDAASTFIHFGGDGLPDTEWLGIHEKHARQRDEIARANALQWVIDTFNRYAVLSEDRASVQAGSYRLFEFAVSLEWARLYKRGALNPAFPNAHNPSDEEVARDEIAACQGNFTALIAFAEELEPYGPLGRWTATVPDAVQQELEQFSQAYTSALGGLTEIPEHAIALRTYSRELGSLIRSGDDDFAGRAGLVYSWQSILAAR